jgi:hypothetical protein
MLLEKIIVPIAITTPIAASPAPYDYNFRIVKDEDSDSEPLEFLRTFLEPIRITRQTEVKNTLYSFYTYPKNWDGHGAVPPSTFAINNSLRFLNMLPDFIVDDLGHDDLTMTPYGTIVIELKNKGDEHISVEIGDSKLGFFSELKDQSNPSLDQAIFHENALPEQFVSAFNRLYKEPGI